MVQLGQPGKDLNTDIGKLVAAGLPIQIQQALDIVRVIGNEAVHPGVLDLKGDHATASKLFGLINVIAETMISQPKRINEFFQTVMPETKKQQIEKSDAPS